MLVEMNTKEVLEYAEKALSNICDYREKEKERLITEEMKDMEKWVKRFRKVGLGFMCKDPSREKAIHNLKNQTFSDYTLARISYGSQELHLKKVIKSCKSSGSDTILLNENDIWVLHIK